MLRMSSRRTAAQSAVAAVPPATPFAPAPTAATPICRLCCSWSIPFQHAPHSAPAAVACLPQQLVACDFLRILTLHCQCNWQALAAAAATGDGDGDGDIDDAMATTLQRDVVIGCNNYLNAAIIFMQTRSATQRAICSLFLSVSLSLSLFWNNFTIFTILLLLSRGVRLLLLLLLRRL